MSSTTLEDRPAMKASSLACMADRGVAYLTLDEAGAIADYDGAIEAMFDYSPEELLFRHISSLLPRLQYFELIQDGRINERLHYLCHIGLPFLVRPRDQQQYEGYLSLNVVGNSFEQRVRLCIRRKSLLD